MKKLHTTLLLLIIGIGIGHCLAQSNDSIKKDIVVKCQKIDSLRKLNDVEIDDYYIDAGHNDESMHVGQIVTLKKDKSILLIELFTETSSKYFYFDNEELNNNIDELNNNPFPININDIPLNNIIYHNIDLNNNSNIINVLNSLITNLNNNNNNNNNNVVISINSPNNLQNVVVTTDDEDLGNLHNSILTTDHDTKCSICMSSMVKNETVILLKCNHIFHNECITQYLKEYNYKCPVCRAEVGKPKYNI
jgi:hypothetical protein